MKRLFLLRHAKSDWGEPGLADHDRPLAPRGRRAAPKVAEYMASSDLRPALVLVSSALRAQQTLEFFADVVGDATVAVQPDIYGADVDDLIDLIRRTPAAAPSLMLVGHNPTMQDLAVTLASGGPDLRLASTKFPTAALAVLDAEIDDWKDLGPRTATMTYFVTPKVLGA